MIRINNSKVEQLRLFLKQYLQDVDVTPFIQAFHAKRHLKKKAFLIQPHEPASFLAFIYSGSFRVFFYDVKGVEITVWFSFERMMISDLLSFYKETPASFYVQAIEESEIGIIYKDTLENLYHQYPEYLAFGKRYAEHVAIRLMERMLALQTTSAEERYLELLANPPYLEKIPLKYLASYLGITDSSLSRLRKKLQK